MSIPIIQSIGDVFLVDWQNENIRMKIDRISERSEGVSAEVLITQSGGHLYHARLNLLSPHAKKVMANELLKRVNNLDWQTMVEQAFTKTLVEYRRGEPVVKVGNLPRRQTPRYRLKPLILENQINALYGHGGSAKSLLTHLIAVIVQSGIWVLGFSGIQGNVLILDWEASQETCDERVKAIKNGLDIANSEMPFYKRCYHLLTHDITEIQREIIEKKIQLVIVDSAGMATGFDGDYHSVAIEMLRALRALKISVLLIDHKPKAGNTMFGSVYKFNECRSAFEIKATQEAGSNCMDIGIFHTKYNDTIKQKPLGFHIEFEGSEDYTEKITFTQEDVADIPELEARLSRRQRIINILKQGAMPTGEIAEILQDNEHAVRTELNRNKKLFVKTEGGWGLLLTDEYS